MEGRGPHIHVIDGTRWWLLSSEGELYTNHIPEGLHVPVRRVRARLGHSTTLAEALADEPCLDPSFLLVFFTLEPVEETTWAGRDALRIRAIPRGGRKPFESVFYDADEVEFWMDIERGVVLRYEARSKGKPFATVAISEIVFDQPLSDHLFAFPKSFLEPIRLVETP